MTAETEQLRAAPYSRFVAPIVALAAIVLSIAISPLWCLIVVALAVINIVRNLREALTAPGTVVGPLLLVSANIGILALILWWFQSQY
jgi:hypothetical protein